MPHNLSPFRFQFSPPLERRYNSTLSIWLSVDPMSDKYPRVSPYTYCANNPVRLVDPNGREIWVIGEDGSKYKYIQGQLLDKNGNQYDFHENSFEGNAVRALNTLKNTTTGNKLVSTFELSTEFDVTIEHSANTHCTNEIVSAESGKIVGGTIEWNEVGCPILTTDGVQRNAISDLGHEFSHIYDNVKGINGLNNMIYDNLTKSEWRATYKENLIRKELGLPYRTYYTSIHIINGEKTIHQTYLLNKKGKPKYPNDLEWKIKY